ncbi:hypothetical protein C0J52_02562 [Blattella germanica]|nr:hypothetical protein C0J52_02562 [Blattella germanica]
MQRRSNKEKSIGEHFTFFLVKNGHLDDEYSIHKKKLKEVFTSEYLAKHHVIAEPWKLMEILYRANCIIDKRKKKKKNINSSSEEIVTFKAQRVQEIVTNYGQKSEEAALDKSLSIPIVKVYVTQQHAFQTKFEKNPGSTETECKLCRKKFRNAADYEDHRNLEIHKIRETYRLDRRYLRTNQNIHVQPRQESDDQSDEIILRENSRGSLPIEIKNTSSTMSISLDFEFLKSQAYMYPLVLKLSTNKNDSSYVLKELIFHIQSEFMDDLKPSSPYKKPLKPVQKHINERPLGQFTLPQPLRRVINHGLKEFKNMPEIDVKKLQEVKSLLQLDSAVQVSQLLTKEKYSKFFSLLLYFEEHQMSIDIHMYDSDDRTMQEVKENKKLLSLKVPGLSENRPSVLRGDKVHVTIQGDDSVKYEGNVHKVLESEVWLGFNKSLREKFIQDMKFHVEYTINRLPMRVQHRALSMIHGHGVSHILFPTQYSLNTNNTKVSTWYNKKLAGNPEQQQAVRNIVSGTAYPAPYLIFGPPGTGKTVTVCEAITQLYYLKPDEHILVCAPSNSAADEITKRLLSTAQGNIPESGVFRMYAASRNPINIPPEFKKCCNFEREFFYPPKKDILKYRIVVVTLMTAGRLVSGGIPAGHFSHLFIDESGQALEPETVIPLAGMLTSEREKGISLLERLMLHCDLYKRNEKQIYFNIQEIEVIASYVEKILDDKFCGRKLNPADIGIITPYRKQGQEHLVIIISTVRSTMELLDEDYKFHLGFLKNPKRFNVALTRAKALLIVVGDPNVLQCDVNWRELITFCKDHGSYKGCQFNLTDIPMPVEDLTFNLSSLKIDSIDNKLADGPQWRGDI